MIAHNHFVNPQVMDAKVLLQISFGDMNTNLITPTHKNVINLDWKNDKTTLHLLHEHGGIHSAWHEAKCGEKATKLGE